MLLDAHLLIGNGLGQLLDFCVTPIDLDALARGREARLLDLRLEFVKLHREVGAQAVLVGANFGFRQRQRALQCFRREPLDTVAVGGKQDNDDQGRDQEAQRHEHRGVKGDQATDPELTATRPPPRANSLGVQTNPLFWFSAIRNPR